jgi:hypothetical protein
MIGEWEPSEANGVTTTAQDNRITGYIVNRLHTVCFPIQPGAPAPLFPKFPLKAIVLGKPFSGKTTALQILEKGMLLNTYCIKNSLIFSLYIETGIRVINSQNLISSAIEAYKRNPVVITDILSSTNKIDFFLFKLTDENEDKPETTDQQVQEEKTVVVEEKKPPVPAAPVLAAEKSKPLLDKKEKTDLKKRKNTVIEKEAKTVEIVEPEVEYITPVDDLMVRRLGEIALASLNNGEPIRDEIVVHIIIEQIKRLPKEKGWIIDGFPLTYNQAKVLEKALSGYDDDKPFPVRPKKESILAPNPKPDAPAPKHTSAIDIVLNLDVSNENVLKRSAGRFCKTPLRLLYQHTFYFYTYF